MSDAVPRVRCPEACAAPSGAAILAMEARIGMLEAALRVAMADTDRSTVYVHLRAALSADAPEARRHASYCPDPDHKGACTA